MKILTTEEVQLILRRTQDELVRASMAGPGLQDPVFRVRCLDAALAQLTELRAMLVTEVALIKMAKLP